MSRGTGFDSYPATGGFLSRRSAKVAGIFLTGALLSGCGDLVYDEEDFSEACRSGDISCATESSTPARTSASPMPETTASSPSTPETPASTSTTSASATATPTPSPTSSTAPRTTQQPVPPAPEQPARFIPDCSYASDAGCNDQGELLVRNTPYADGQVIDTVGPSEQVDVICRGPGDSSLGDFSVWVVLNAPGQFADAAAFPGQNFRTCEPGDDPTGNFYYPTR